MLSHLTAPATAAAMLLPCCFMNLTVTLALLLLYYTWGTIQIPLCRHLMPQRRDAKHAAWLLAVSLEQPCHFCQPMWITPVSLGRFWKTTSLCRYLNQAFCPAGSKKAVMCSTWISDRTLPTSNQTKLNDGGVRAVVITKSKISFHGRLALLVVFFIVIDNSSIRKLHDTFLTLINHISSPSTYEYRHGHTADFLWSEWSCHCYSKAWELIQHKLRSKNTY